MDMFNIDTAKSYATEANLMTALKKLGLDDQNPLVVRNREGRWTAVFHIAWSSEGKSGNVMFAAQHGFKTFN
jgi:hypothetical protein